MGKSFSGIQSVPKERNVTMVCPSFVGKELQIDFQAATFDMDGVLVPSDEYHDQTGVRVAARWRGKVNRSIYERCLRRNVRMDALSAGASAVIQNFGYSLESRL